MAGITFHYCFRWSLRSDVASLWPFVSDSDRFRAVTGFPSATFTEEPLPEGGSRRMARFRMYGFPIVWEEQPFEWIRNREFQEAHDYEVGPLKYVRVSVRLEPRPEGGTDLTYEVWARPGNILGYPGILVQIGLLFRYRFGRAFRRIDDFIQARAPQPFKTPRTPIGSAGRTRLREFANILTTAGHDPALVSRLIDHLQSAPDDQLSRMRPYALAERWGTDRYATLELFLRATRLGLLDLSWDMLCPDCRGAKHRPHNLSELSHSGYCPSCNIHYEVDFARSVEATFQLNRSIKSVDRQEFCIGSPQNTPHILLQQVVAPGDTRSITMALEPGSYRWRAPRLAARSQDIRTVNTTADPSSGRATFAANESAQAQTCTITVNDESVQVQPGAVNASATTLMIRNESDRPQVILLEQTAWSEQACTAAEVTALQAFRDLFSSEALKPGESISVESMAILFTDLKGSTTLYRTVGDAPAFRRVMDHFDILREGVAANHGGLVKTIGDAIMAVFSDPADAVAASLDILSGIRAYNAEHPSQPLVLKMGIHHGACIAVTLNERLDYFGSVVNLAARLESQSQGEDVVISEAVASDPSVQELVQKRRVRVEPFASNLKGFAESFSLRRLTPGSAPETGSGTPQPDRLTAAQGVTTI
jgi:adenylate cyclase